MLRIVKVTEPITVERINVCIYAPPGLGKTTLGFTAEAPLNLDFDKGAHRASNRKDIVPVSKWSDVAEAKAEDFAEYKTIIVDTAGRCLDFLTQDIISENPKHGKGGALTLPGYGALKSRFAAWLKMLNTFGKDVVLIAHMDEQRNGDDVIERLDVQGGSKGEIYKSVDAMGRIFIRDKNKRVLDFSPRENAFGKNPANLDPMEVPHPGTNPNFLAEVIAKIKGSMNTLSEEQRATQTVLEDWCNLIREFADTDDFNRNLVQVKAAPKTVQAFFNQRAKELGFAYNKKTTTYEALEAAAV